jgi:predicted ester cyclase
MNPETNRYSAGVSANDTQVTELVVRRTTGRYFTMKTTTEQNKAVIRRFFDAWNSRQPDAFDDLVAPNVVRHCEATPGVEARNLDQVKEFLQQDTAVFPDSVQTIKFLVAEGNLVATWTTYEGTQQGAMGPFQPSGRKARFDFGAVFRIEAGKIAEWWVTWDNMTILRALGHLPTG